MQEISSEAKVKAMTIVYLPLILIPATAATACFYFTSTGEIVPETPDMADFYWKVAYVVVAAGLGAGVFSFRRTINKIKEDGSSVAGTLNSFQASCLIRSAFLEIPAWLGVIFAFKTGDMSFLAVTAAFLVVSLFMELTVRSTILKAIA